MSDTSTRTFQYRDEKSDKFWEIARTGSAVKVRFGKTGTSGQTQEKVFADAAAAGRHVDKLIHEKTGKGYVEIRNPDSSSRSASGSCDREAGADTSGRDAGGDSPGGVAQTFTPFESARGAMREGSFVHNKDSIEFALPLGRLTPDPLDYTLEVGDTVAIKKPVFGCRFDTGTVIEILEHDRPTLDILERNESEDMFSKSDIRLLNELFNLWGSESSASEPVTVFTDCARTCIVQINEPCEIKPAVIKALSRRFPDGDFSRLEADEGDRHEFHFDGIDVRLSRTGARKFNAEIRVRSLLDGSALKHRLESENFKRAILASDRTENLAWSDNIIPVATLNALNEQLDIMISREPDDFHPGSGTVVRDIVHPSLYCLVNGVSDVSISPLSDYNPETVKKIPKWSTDFWGRLYEGSEYQWLPAEFMVDDHGKVSINSYINNLDESKYPVMYELIAEIFGRFVPMFESVLSNLMNVFVNDNDKRLVKTIPVRNRRLQVVTKLVEYRVSKEEEFEGVWHVEGMSHENILATGLCIVRRDSNFIGADIEFKRHLFAQEAVDLICSVQQDAPRPTELMDGSDVRPLGTAATPAGRAMVWPNSHIHKVSKMDSSDGKDATRRILVFWLVNPDTPIASTANVPKQQGRMTLAQARKNRLSLMKERTRKKDRYNVREVFLCEH